MMNILKGDRIVIFILGLILFNPSLRGQSVTVVSNDCLGGSFVFNLNGDDGSGRNVYSNADVQMDIRYNPAMTRWEIIGQGGDMDVFFATDMNTFAPNPPDDMSAVWSAVGPCTGASSPMVSGDGTQSMDMGDPCDMLGGDTDGDGVCDDSDICPGSDDNADMDMDNIPDGCDANPNDPDGVIVDAPCIDMNQSYTFLLDGDDGMGRNIYFNALTGLEVAYNSMAGQWEVRARDPGTDVFYVNTFASLPNPPDNTTSTWTGTGPCDQQAVNDIFGSGTQNMLGCDLMVTSIDSTAVACGGDMDGTITITATSSNGPITYNISGPVNDSNNSGVFSGLPSGMYIVNVTDGSFPPMQCDSNLTATIEVSDVSPPTISCPANITVNTDIGQCDAVVTFNDPVGMDNCPGATTMQTGGPASGSTFLLGNTTITYTVTDASGLTNSCSFDIIVQDNEDPEITCPANISVNTDMGLCTATVDYVTPVGTDNCMGEITMLSAGLGSGAAFPAGTTTETYEVMDLSGNVASCSFDVIVQDGESPIVITQPFTLQLNDQGQGTLQVSDVDNGSSDNCNLMLSLDITSFDCNDVGANTVMLTGNDGVNPPVTVAATVTVEDKVIPALTCQDISINLDMDDMATIYAADLLTSLSDACGVADTTLSISMFNETHIGDNNVIVTALDVNGNTNTCTSLVMVGEYIPIPTLSEWGIIILLLLMIIIGAGFMKNSFSNKMQKLPPDGLM